MSHKLEPRLKRGDYNFISAGYISGPNPDEMFKIVVQPIAFKEDHLLMVYGRSFVRSLDSVRLVLSLRGTPPLALFSRPVGR